MRRVAKPIWVSSGDSRGGSLLLFAIVNLPIVPNLDIFLSLEII